MSRPVIAEPTPTGGLGLPAAPPIAWRSIVAVLALLALVAASFASLDLRWQELFAAEAGAKTIEFLAGFLPPEHSSAFLSKVAAATAETVAMSALGTLMAAAAGLALALPASRRGDAGPVLRAARSATRLVLNALRAVPELVWASILVIAAGLGPLPGTLALAAHTTGVLGRLFADALENLPTAPARALHDNGAPRVSVFLYATLPQALPQLLSYTLYRWENNIRAAAVLGVVGAGGLGQMLHYHLSLFQTHETATVIVSMLVIVLLVDVMSWLARRRLVT